MFADPKDREGLGEDMLEHEAHRRDAPGRVEVWPVFRTPEQAEADTDWTRPVDEPGSADPKFALARRMADTIKAWLEDGERLVPREGAERPIRAGDVMVLVRKRDAFVRALTRELKSRAIPVAGEDKLALTAHIAVEDLIAIGRVTLNPHDDLALAAALKSPLLGLNEDDLFELAHGREDDVSLYRTLRRRGRENPRWKAASERVAEWRQRVDAERPYEFYARILGVDGGRRLFLARLGEEASDVLDEFLAAALEERDADLPGLEAFLASLRKRVPIVKREMDTRLDEVRVMTVHAAKGQEAPIVFLVDPGSQPVAPSHLPRLVPLGSAEEEDAPMAWRGPGLGTPDAVAEAVKALTERNEQEYRRLLYVGMTRAENRLVVCGYSPKTLYEGTWHAQVTRTLVDGGHCRPLTRTTEDGTTETVAHVFELPREAETAEHVGEETASSAGAASRTTSPAWLQRNAAREDDLPRPLSPSGATALIDGEPLGAPAKAGPLLGAALGVGERGTVDDMAAMRRGTAVHRLLQVLPTLPADQREAAAKRYVTRMCAGLPEGWCDRVVDSALGVLRDPALASLFEGEARAEVPIMGTLRIGGAPRAVSGVVDRLVLTPGRALLVDYKTGRNPPLAERAVPLVHVAQMALYRALLSPLFPDREVGCALVYTEAPVRHDLSPARMDAVLERVLRGEGIPNESGSGVEDGEAPR